MASKYGVVFTKSKMLHVLAYIVSVHNLFWGYVRDYFSGNKWSGAYTKQK